MPAGLLAELSPSEVADLLAYLRAPREERKIFPGNTPRPVERDGSESFDLSADRAELYGPEILYEPDVGCLGYWHGATDRAVWTVVNDVAREVDVWIEWACAEHSAGARFVLDGLDGSVGAVVTGTGPDWSRYRWRRVGAATLPAGTRRVECRPEFDPPAALFDLRRVLLAPRFERWIAALAGMSDADAHAALDCLVEDPHTSHALLDAYAAGTVTRATFAPRHLEALLTHPDADVAARALEWLGE